MITDVTDDAIPALPQEDYDEATGKATNATILELAEAGGADRCEA